MEGAGRTVHNALWIWNVALVIPVTFQRVCRSDATYRLRCAHSGEIAILEGRVSAVVRLKDTELVAVVSVYRDCFPTVVAQHTV